MQRELPFSCSVTRADLERIAAFDRVMTLRNRPARAIHWNRFDQFDHEQLLRMLDK